MPIHITQLTDKIAIAAQLQPDDLPKIAGMGIRSIINNLPDGDGAAGQPTEAELCAAAEAAGLFYAYLPVSAAGFDERSVWRMRALIGELPKPLLAFCLTGARSAQLYRATCGEPGA